MHPVSEPSTPGKVIPGTFRFSHGLGVGDLNGDGRLDVICTGGWWEQPESGRKSSTPWTFHPAQLGDAVADMIAYDVNHDGKADVIASSAHQYGIWWFEQGDVKDGSPVFTKHDLFPDLVSETHALIAADINGDGLKDLVTGKRFWSHGTERGRLRQARPALLVRGQPRPRRQDRLHPARDRRPERHRHPVRRRRLQRRRPARYRHGQQEGRVPARTGRSVTIDVAGFRGRPAS